MGSCIKFKSSACCIGKHTGNDTAITQEVEEAEERVPWISSMFSFRKRGQESSKDNREREPLNTRDRHRSRGVDNGDGDGDGDGDVGSCIKFKSLACCSGKHTGNDTAITQEVEATSCCRLGKVLFCKKGGEDRKVNIEEVEIEMEMEMEQLNIKGVEEDANDTAITQEVEATSCCRLGKVLFCKKGGEDRKVNIEEVGIEMEMEQLSVEEDAVVEPDSRGDTSGWRCTRWFREAWLYTKLFSGKETAKKEESTAGEDFEGVQLSFDAEDSVN